jgi:hypothetical protein
VLQPAHAVAKAELHDGHHLAAAGFGEGSKLVDLCERADERFLADHVLAGCESAS